MDNKARWRQAWTIAKIELKRAFFSKRAFWVYGLALFPSIIFLGYNITIQFRRERLSSQGLVKPALIHGIRIGETPEEVRSRLGKPPMDRYRVHFRHAPRPGQYTGITTDKIEPEVEARFVRLNILTAMRADVSSRIYEFEVYGEDDSVNLALNKPASGSQPCTPEEGPEKAFNGSVSGGIGDRWCTRDRNGFLQVDLGASHKLSKIVLKHGSAGGESADQDAALFNVQASKDNRIFFTIVNPTGARFVNQPIANRQMHYFDGVREVRLFFENERLVRHSVHKLVSFEEDRRVFAGIFQYFYLRLAIFFGCLGIFMNLFRGEMLDRTLHFWFLAPVRREVLLAGKYGAGLIASMTIFVGGALLSFGILLQMHSAAEVSAYWQTAGMEHVFWYAAAAALGCIGYGSFFLAAGLLLRNPIIPAAALLAWENINGFLPAILQKLSVLYYLQSLCPTPAPKDETMPALLQMLLAPAAPASRTWAIAGLLAVTALVLAAARCAVRRMQISYGSDV